MKNQLIAIGILSTVLFSCKKEDSSVHPNEFLGQDNLRSFGAVADDPALVAKVPMIISSNFLSAKTFSTNHIIYRTNPGKGGQKVDITPPTVAITSPSNGSSVSVSTNVSVSVSASDNKGISSVSFSVDGVLQSSMSSSPFTFFWNTTGVASGTHTLTAIAKDAAGNNATTSIIVTLNTTILETPSSTSSHFIKMPPVANQGSEGSCVAFAIGYNARSAEQYYKTNTSSFSYSDNIFSPEYLFNQIKIDATLCSGSAIITALNFLQNNGICSWQSLPYSTTNGCSILPTTAQINEAANYKITSYSVVPTIDINAIKAMISSNHPLVISFVTDSYFHNAGSGFIWKNYSSTLYGRHAATICGYDDAKHAVKIVNSWGTGWGDAGYTWIDYDFLPVISVNGYVINL